MSKIALVLDGDYLVFSSMAGAEVETDWGDDMWTLECDHKKAWESLMSKINSIVTRRKAWRDAKIIMCFTDDVNWRKSVLPTYKENRKGSRKPVGYRAFVERVKEWDGWTYFLRDNLEGDDCMGIIGTRPQLVGCDHAVLVSCDKDFKTIPDCEFFWLTSGQILKQDQETADYWHMYQTLIGDATDGYDGIKGVGPETAEEFLKEPFYYEQETTILKSGKNKGQERTQWVKKPQEGTSLTLWDCVLTLGAKAGMTPDECLVQAQVARICRITDYDLKTKEVILWQP